VIETIPLGDILWLAAGLGVAGVLAGLLAGIFGIGGGAVIVPVFDEALAYLGYSDEIRMHVAVGTSLAVIIPTSIRSFTAHRARGAVDMAVLRGWVIGVPAGVALASVVAAFASGNELRLAFAVVATIVALRMLFNPKNLRLGDQLPGPVGHNAVGGLIGFLSTLMGVGGGVLSTTYLTLFNRPIHQAVATSAGVGVLIAVPGALGYIAAGWGAPGLPPLSLGYVNFVGVALLIPLTLLLAPVGVRIAHALPARALQSAFAVFLLVMAARYAWVWAAA
jgi:uncharacterized membrane protein YfcA